MTITIMSWNCAITAGNLNIAMMLYVIQNKYRHLYMQNSDDMNMLDTRITSNNYVDQFLLVSFLLLIMLSYREITKF